MIPWLDNILAKYQLGHSYTFWTMPFLIFSPVQMIIGHPLLLIHHLTSLQSCFKVKIMNFARGKRPSMASERLSMWCLLKSIKRRRSLILKSNWFLKYGFCNKSFRKDEPLTIWTHFTHLFVIKIRFSSNQNIGEEYLFWWKKIQRNVQLIKGSFQKKVLLT